MRKESQTTRDAKAKRIKGVYVHIPFCLSKCAYCGFYSVPLGSFDVDVVLEAILEEARVVLEELSPPYTLYVGGGTPTCLGNSFLDFLERLLNILSYAPLEFTVEANPATFDGSFLKDLKALGVGRLSLGVQSLDDNLLSFLRRSHDASTALSSVEVALSVFDNVNVDMIFGIPGQTVNGLIQDLKRIVSLGVIHISLYGLSFDEDTLLRKWEEEGAVKPVDDALWRDMYLQARDFLVSCGFRHYEISNYCKKGKICIHNMVYWSHRIYIGLGPSSASFDGRRRIYNPKDLETYVEGVFKGKFHRKEDVLSDDELWEEKIILYLRTDSGLPLRKLPDGLRKKVLSVIENMPEGILLAGKGKLRMNPSYFPIFNYVVSNLLAKLL